MAGQLRYRLGQRVYGRLRNRNNEEFDGMIVAVREEPDTYPYVIAEKDREVWALEREIEGALPTDVDSIDALDAWLDS